MLLQAGATELCLQVQDAALLPGPLQPNAVWVLPHFLVAAYLSQLAGPVLGASEWRYGALNCIEPAIFLGAHLQGKWCPEARQRDNQQMLLRLTYVGKGISVLDLCMKQQQNWTNIHCRVVYWRSGMGGDGAYPCTLIRAQC